MTQDDELQQYNLSRRRVLAGLGAVGIASAGTGLGTSAFFSDEEEFTDNRLQAGTLDLKLDYKATYFGGPGRLADVQSMGYPDAEIVEGDEGRYLLGQAPTLEDEEAWEDLVQGEEFDFCSPAADEFLVNGDGIPMFTLEDVTVDVPLRMDSDSEFARWHLDGTVRVHVDGQRGPLAEWLRWWSKQLS